MRKRRKTTKVRWVTKNEVKHYRTGKMMRRRDGQPFRFPVFTRR